MKQELGMIHKKWSKALMRVSMLLVLVAAVVAVFGIAPSFARAQFAPVTCPNFGLERTTAYNLQGAAYAYGYGVATDAAGNAYAVGEQYVPATGLDAFITKYDKDGNFIWSDVYDASGNESGYGIAVDSTGNNIYVVGRQQDNASLNSDVFVRKYDATGAVMWTQVYNSGGADIARSAALDSAGNVYAAGYREKAGGGIEAMLLSYDAGGTLRGGFPVAYTATYNASAFGVAVSGSDVYITGYTQPTSANTDMFLRKYTTAGSFVWMQTYDSISYTGVPMPQSTIVTDTAWAQCPSGSTVVSATDTGQGDNHGINSSTTGCQGWEGSPNNITTTTYDPFGNPTTTVTPGYAQCTFICSVYTKMVPNGNLTDIGYGVAVDAAGIAYVTGYQETNGGDVFLRKYDSAGTLVWGDTYNSGGTQNDVGREVVTGNSGRIFIVGRQQTNADDSFLNEYYETKKVQVLPLGILPTGVTPDWTTTASVHCVDTSPGPGTAWEGIPTRTPCDTGGHAFIPDNNTIESCTATTSGSTCWYDSWGSKNCTSANTSTTCFATLINSGLYPLSSLVSTYLYKGSAGNGAEFGYGVAQTPSSSATYASTANDVYVVGYQSSNGGEMFLNKYSCNAAMKPGSGSGLAAYFSVSPSYSGPAPFTVTTDASASAGSIVKYEWDWNYNGTTFNASTASADKDMIATHEYTASGTYSIAVRVTDNLSKTDIGFVSVNVSPNIAPIADFKACDTNDQNCVPPATAPFTGAAPLRVNVDGVASADPNASQGGFIKSFSWDWGDGTVTSIGQKATHLYSALGLYTITLTVKDNGGMIGTATKNISVIAQYVCTSGTGAGGACVVPAPVCGPGNVCNECLSSNDCGVGYACLGTACTAGTQCPDNTLCPADGKCPEVTTCNPLVSGATCPDGSLCPTSGLCPAAKNICTLSGSVVDTQCYVEEQGGCSINADCTASITGGVCNIANGLCRYARCSNDTSLSCTTDNDCASGDGICNGGSCVYIYDCAYGPGLGSGVTGQYGTSTPDTMPTMPLGVQPNGEACTQPTADAPNNCEGINGCLYYNYTTATGAPVQNSNNSVANCVNTFENGTGCVYYQYYSLLSTATTPTTKTNCLPRYAEKSTKSPQAGIPAGCFVVDKGTSGKEYNCTAIDGCYYYLDGSVDCTYKEVTATTCTTNAECAAVSTLPLMIPVCNVATGLCEYQGNGCAYEPNPKGAISCPGAQRPATGGDNFVQCMLNPDSVLPGFLNTSNSALSSCSVSADCPTGEICLSGTCYPQCQANVDCASGEQCTSTCTTSLDCTGGLVCNAGICTIGTSCTPGTTCPDGQICPASGVCPSPLTCTPGTICPNGAVCPADGICPSTVPACAGAFPTGTLPFGTISTTMGLTTAQDALCSYSQVVTDPYASMTPFTTTGTTSHSTTATGLFTGINTYYAKCQDAGSGTITNACQISFGVGTSCTASAQCAGGFMCVSGTCQPPVCSGATPIGALAPGTTTTTIGLTTAVSATCKYSKNSADAYSAMTPFITTGSTTHSSSVSGLVTGSNTHYVRCQDATAAETFCQIPFSVGVCNQQYKCDTGFMCIPNTGTGICTPMLGCTPGTTCPDGQICPASGVCPSSLCPSWDPLCSASFCPPGTVYDAITGACESCAINPSLPGCAGWLSFCALNPTNPLCAGGSGSFGAIPSGTASCNTLGYTFTGTAVTPSGNCDLVAIILALLSWLAWIIALLAVLSGLRAAYLYITSMGDERKLILARNYLIYTTIGVGVSVLTFSIVAITRVILNI